MAAQAFSTERPCPRGRVAHPRKARPLPERSEGRGSFDVGGTISRDGWGRGPEASHGAALPAEARTARGAIAAGRARGEHGRRPRAAERRRAAKAAGRAARSRAASRARPQHLDTPFLCQAAGSEHGLFAAVRARAIERKGGTRGREARGQPHRSARARPKAERRAAGDPRERDRARRAHKQCGRAAAFTALPRSGALEGRERKAFAAEAARGRSAND